MKKEQDNKLSFLDELITHTKQGFRSSMYQKPTYIRQNLHFNSHNPFNANKGSVNPLQHWAKVVHDDPEEYQEEMIV